MLPASLLQCIDYLRDRHAGYLPCSLPSSKTALGVRTDHSASKHVISRNSSSQSNFQLSYFCFNGTIPKLSDPMFNDAMLNDSIAGLATNESARCSSIDMPTPQPLATAQVMITDFAIQVSPITSFVELEHSARHRSAKAALRRNALHLMLANSLGWQYLLVARRSASDAHRAQLS
jgi:hypothetical protein